MNTVCSLRAGGCGYSTTLWKKRKKKLLRSWTLKKLRLVEDKLKGSYKNKWKASKIKLSKNPNSIKVPKKQPVTQDLGQKR